MINPENPPEELGPEINYEPSGTVQHEKIEQGPGLIWPQQEQLRVLIEEFSDVFNEKPGKASGMRHEINTPAGTIV